MLRLWMDLVRCRCGCVSVCVSLCVSVFAVSVNVHICALLKGDSLPECSAALAIHIWANRNDPPKKCHQ